MAKVGNNIVVTGLSGKLGNLIVFRTHGAKTVVAQAPQKRKGEPTEAQEQHQTRFQEAILYGKASITDAAKKAAYKASAEDGQSAFNVAVADFLRAPHIDEIDVSHYSGQADSFIEVRAVDDFKVTEVTVSIFNSDGSEVEQGSASVQTDGNWRYVVTATNESLSGDKIIVRVSDLPGNLTEKEQAI
ncbi:MAG: hypothetical protein AB2L24_22765 [Mangrovibacterium sp.]